MFKAKPNFKSVLASMVAALVCAPSLAATNLVVNGDFESGNGSFASEYQYSPAQNTAAGQYSVRSDVSGWKFDWVGNADHTSGSGNMFVANGASRIGDVVWEQKVAVDANTNYFFEAYVMNVCCNANLYGGPNSPAMLNFTINGELVGANTTSLANTGTWEGLSSTWNSGGATFATLQLLNNNTALGGNDFAVDDISLSTVSTVPTIASAVPEPETYAMMLAGLGAITAVARRRRPR